MINKIEKIVLGIGMLFSIVIPTFYRQYNMKNEYITSISANSEDVSYNIASIDQTEKYVTISGWIAKQGISTFPYNVCIILWNSEQQCGYKRETMVQTREDITSYFNDGIDYSAAGFRTTFILEGQRIPAGEYEIIITTEVDGNLRYVYTESVVEVTEND